MRRQKNSNQTINSGTLADVAFLLLIFFMVATSMQRQKSLSMQLPPLVNAPPQKILQQKVLSILISRESKIMIGDKEVNKEFGSQIESHLLRIIDKQLKPIVNVEMHPDANYQVYLQLLSEIKKAIKSTKSKLAIKYYHKAIDQLNQDEWQDLSKRCGIRITEKEIEV